MPTVKIDGKDYEIDELPKEAKEQLLSLQVTEREIQHLNAQLAIFQTAKSAYSKALIALMAKEGKSESIQNSVSPSFRIPLG
jgi:hypothetical protein